MSSRCVLFGNGKQVYPFDITWFDGIFAGDNALVNRDNGQLFELADGVYTLRLKGKHPDYLLYLWMHASGHNCAPLILLEDIIALDHFYKDIGVGNIMKAKLEEAQMICNSRSRYSCSLL